MAHECRYLVCTAYCSGVPFGTDICSGGAWRDTVFIQKRSAGGIQFDVDLLSPLHFKATKILQQQGCPEVVWVRPNDTAPRFANRIQLEHFDEKSVDRKLEADKTVKRRKTLHEYFQRFEHDLQYYDSKIETLQDKHVLEYVLAWNAKDLLTTRTHAGDKCRHYLHVPNYELCSSRFLDPPKQWAALSKHCLKSRRANVPYTESRRRLVSFRKPPPKETRASFRKFRNFRYFANLSQKKSRAYGNWDKNEEDDKKEYINSRNLVDYAGLDIAGHCIW